MVQSNYNKFFMISRVIIAVLAVSSVVAAIDSYTLKEEQTRFLANDVPKEEVLELLSWRDASDKNSVVEISLKKNKKKKKKKGKTSLFGLIFVICCVLPVYLCLRCTGVIKSPKKDKHGSDSSDVDDHYKKVKKDKKKDKYAVKSQYNTPGMQNQHPQMMQPGQNMYN